MYTDFVALPALFFGYNVSFKTLDKGLLEIVGPAGVIQTVSQGGRQLRKMQSGLIYHYAFIMLCSLTFLIAVVGLGIFFFFVKRIFILLQRRPWFFLLIHKSSKRGCTLPFLVKKKSWLCKVFFLLFFCFQL